MKPRAQPAQAKLRAQTILLKASMRLALKKQTSISYSRSILIKQEHVIQ